MLAQLSEHCALFLLSEEAALEDQPALLGPFALQQFPMKASPNRPKSALLKSRAVIMLFILLTSLMILKLQSHSCCSQGCPQPSDFQLVLPCFLSSRSNISSLVYWSPASRKSFQYSPEISWIVCATLPFWQILGWSEPSMITMVCDSDAFFSCLKND